MHVTTVLSGRFSRPALKDGRQSSARCHLLPVFCVCITRSRIVALWFRNLLDAICLTFSWREVHLNVSVLSVLLWHLIKVLLCSLWLWFWRWVSFASLQHTELCQPSQLTLPQLQMYTIIRWTITEAITKCHFVLFASYSPPPPLPSLLCLCQTEHVPTKRSSTTAFREKRGSRR